MTIYALTKTDGTVSIMHTLDGDGIEAELAKWPAELRAEIVSHVEISQADIPQDRQFRNAWVLNNGKVEPDYNKSITLTEERLRFERNGKLEELDKEQLIAIGAGDEARRQEIEAEKQVYRDLFDGLSWPEDLAGLASLTLTDCYNQKKP